MNYVSDALTIGIVLVLLFGSVALYLYTRIQQTEQKNSLLESILLDLKMSAEIKSYNELPADEEDHSVVVVSAVAPSPRASVSPTLPTRPVPPSSVSTTNDTLIDVVEMDQYTSVIEDAVNDASEDASTEQIHITPMGAMDHYEDMKVKELQELGRARGISGAGTMKKNAMIEALRAHDREAASASGSMASSFLDASEDSTLSFH